MLRGVDVCKRAAGLAAGPHRRGGRKRVYGDKVLGTLTRVWQIVGSPRGKRLAACLDDVVDALERHDELVCHPTIRGQLRSISAATIAPMLASDRSRLSPKGRSGTNPGRLLKSQIPIRTLADWDDARPGFVEIDLVAHSGANASGDYRETLRMTNIVTVAGDAAAPNRAQRVSNAIPESRCC